MTTELTSTGMPPIAPTHDALDTQPVLAGKPSEAIQSLLGEGKAQVSTTLGGVAEAVRDIAARLEANGAAPLAKYVHEAAETVADWSATVERKSVDDLVGDTRTLVRTSPALAVGMAVAAGFAGARIFRAGR